MIEVKALINRIWFQIDYKKHSCISLHINMLRELIKFKWDNSEKEYKLA